MWNKKGEAMAFQATHSTTLISRDSTIVGDINFSGDLEIQGQVKGNIVAQDNSNASVRLVEGGKVLGNIHAPKVLVNGTIEGDVHCTEQVELAPKAIVNGNVHYNLIEMAKGAQVNGSLVYAGATSTQSIKPVSVELKPVKGKTA